VAVFPASRNAPRSGAGFHDVMRVLLVEDEVKLARAVRRGLQQEGYAVDIAATGDDGLHLATEVGYDAVVLDVMLPGLDGIEVCRRMRARGRWAPVLMLTARDGIAERVVGLDVGADDYLVKPFAFRELLARLRALVRRGGGGATGRPWGSPATCGWTRPPTPSRGTAIRSSCRPASSPCWSS
jgi:DNA-binding response OmpR family regulator